MVSRDGLGFSIHRRRPRRSNCLTPAAAPFPQNGLDRTDDWDRTNAITPFRMLDPRSGQPVKPLRLLRSNRVNLEAKSRYLGRMTPPLTSGFLQFHKDGRGKRLAEFGAAVRVSSPAPFPTSRPDESSGEIFLLTDDLRLKWSSVSPASLAFPQKFVPRSNSVVSLRLPLRSPPVFRDEGEKFRLFGLSLNGEARAGSRSWRNRRRLGTGIKDASRA